MKAPEAGDDVERQSFAKNVLRRIAAQIGEGQDGDGRFGWRRSHICNRRGRDWPRSHIFVAPAVHGHDHAAIERLAQRRNVDLEGVLLHHQAGPDRIEKFGLADHLVRLIQQQGKDVEGSRRKVHRPLWPQQPPVGALQAIAAKLQVHLPRIHPSQAR
ncbi:hypothetical protein RB623_06245 [Mesorhizobium sp. LHD-90]|nr:hypothetical protein [Mesorhizobium sp. LHD-90]MDQ6433648.1 hypothetical protein [Mesorhizobium sp. LHD-90]